MNLKRLLSEVKENVLLKNYTTFKIGGVTRYFLIAQNKKEIISAITIAKENNLPFFILGEGSNTLVSDKRYKGLVIRCQISNIKCQKTEIYTEAGVLLSKVVNAALENNLAGLEWAAGIPGTIGGAIYGNAGAFGESIADITKTVTVLEIKNQKASTAPPATHQRDKTYWAKIKIFKNNDCKFNYRNSIFKKNKNLIILSAVFELKMSNQNRIKKKMKEFLEHRKKTQPDLPSAGSIFKNPKNFSAGELIEKCGLKGKIIGRAQISEKHANFIVNLGGAKAKDVKKLINFIKQKVKKKFGVELKEEIQYLGFEK